LKAIAALFVCFILVNAFFTVITSPVLSSPDILHVPSPAYPTIQAALTAANPGDTIMVANGVYREHDLVIDKDGLTLQGEDKANTIIDGENSNYNIIVVDADNVIIRGFTIKNASQVYKAGVFLYYYSANAYLTNNIFSGCHFSIRAENCTNATVTHSTFLGDTGGAGIQARYCHTGLIENNMFNANHVGAFIIHSTNFMIRNNTFSSSILTGITISYSEQNWVVKNKFTSNNVSLAIRYNGNNVIVGNTISNSVRGLQLGQNSPNNIIHHNNFVDNTKQVYFLDSSPPSNIWSTSGDLMEGNYWSNYTGTDADKNGIGEMSHYIASGNQDLYPLIGPFTEFTVASQTGIANIYTISNSTITDFSYNQVAKQISFRVSDTSDSLGICRIVFPKGLLIPTEVYVNGVSQTWSSISNSTHVALYFSYRHTSQPSNVIIVPEFSTALMVTFLLALTLLVVVLKRKRRET